MNFSVITKIVIFLTSLNNFRHLYISKSYSVIFILATFLLSHISGQSLFYFIFLVFHLYWLSIVYIESSFQHWVSFSFHPYIYIYIFCYSIIEPHHLFIFYLFFSFLKFSSHYSLQKTKTKQKYLLLPISTHLWLHFLRPFPSLFASLPLALLATSPLHFLHLFHFFIIWLFFFPLYLYTSTVTLPPTFPFPLCLFTSFTTLYFTFIIPSSFSLFYN